MKTFRRLLAGVLILSLLSGCGARTPDEKAGDTILATTYPMYYLTCRLTEGIGDIHVELMISEPVSCLHDYTLTTEQMKKIERADLIVMNGRGLEDFMASALESVAEENIVDCGGDDRTDPHYWLSPRDYQQAAIHLGGSLTSRYPAIADNLAALRAELETLQTKMEEDLSDLSCREMITFHDGFGYFAQAGDLAIAAAIEEEEGAEPSAAELKEICDLIEEKNIPAIFVEKNGSTAAAEIIARETGVKIYTLNTLMDGQTDYMTGMEENIRTVKEALS